jgi:DNA-binding transcriptional MerR regulator
MKIICFLRELDLPLNSIGELLSEEHPESVISLLLEQQEKALREEIAQRQSRLDMLTFLRRALKELEHFSV